MNKSIKFGLVILGALYCAYHYQTTVMNQWHFIDSVNLVMHEAGHLLFIPFGHFMAVAGGSLLQVIIPLVFFAYFAFQGQRNSAAVMLLWTATSIFGVAHYSNDAMKMQLPLLGGDNSIHDWNYLLIETGMLRHTNAVATAINFIGFMSVVIAVGLSWLTFRENEGYGADWS
jgi:hypothetical protein